MSTWFQWSVSIILTGIFCAFLAPFPLLLAPLLLGSLVVYLIKLKKIGQRAGFLTGLGSINLVVGLMFLKSRTEDGSDYLLIDLVSLDSANLGLYLAIAFAETVFYCLSVLIIQLIMNHDPKATENTDRILPL